jgi:membrane protein YdbS with pleckstrin-like domain
MGLEYWGTRDVAEKSITLTAAMYAIAIGITSRSRLVFGLTIVMSILFAFAFGSISIDVKQNQLLHTLPQAKPLSVAAIIFIFVIHLAERYNRHVVDRAPFLEFTRETD